MLNLFSLNPKLTPESYTQRLCQVLPVGLTSVVLYGSAASGDHSTRGSDYNIMLVGARWGILELNQVAKVTRDWTRQGNPAPLLFTQDELYSSSDAFPIEMLDIQQSYRVLHGADVIKDLRVHATHLRLMIERGLMSLTLQLREGFAYAQGRPERVAQLMAGTVSSVIVHFRAALRLYNQPTPAHKAEVVAAIKKQVAIDEEAFVQILKIKSSGLRPANALQIFERYLASVAAVAAAVDAIGKGA